MSYKIKGVIFDMDGVLIDAKEWHYEALNKALSLFGMEIGRYDHMVTYDGLPTKKKLELLTLERGLPPELHEFINELKQQYTMQMIFMKCKPNFIHQLALSKLKKIGYKIAVCSNSIQDTVEIMLKRADLLRYLDFFYSNQDVVNPKPSPDIYVKAISRLGIEPKQCLILEDNEKGILAAQNSGANVMKISTVDEVTFENICYNIRFFEDKIL